MEENKSKRWLMSPPQFLCKSVEESGYSNPCLVFLLGLPLPRMWRDVLLGMITWSSRVKPCLL